MKKRIRIKTKFESTNISHEVKALDSKQFDELPLKYIFTPGHALTCSFYHEEDEVLICGDLFISEEDALHPQLRNLLII